MIAARSISITCYERGGMGGITCFDLTHLIQKFIKSSSKSYDTSLKDIGHLYNLRKVGPLDIIREHQDKRKGNYR